MREPSAEPIALAWPAPDAISAQVTALATWHVLLATALGVSLWFQPGLAHGQTPAPSPVTASVCEANAALLNAVEVKQLQLHDGAGADTVLVGEARNLTSCELIFTELTFRFFGGSNELVGTGHATVHGRHNVRLSSGPLATTSVRDGENAFFTGTAQVTSPTFVRYEVDATSQVDSVLPPLADVVLSAPITLEPIAGGTLFRATLLNNGPTIAHYAQLTVVGKGSSGELLDVSLGLALGQAIPAPCGQPGETTNAAIAPGAQAEVIGAFLGPVTAVESAGISWQDLGLLPTLRNFSASGGLDVLTWILPCESTPASIVPWITLKTTPSTDEGGLSHVTYAVAFNDAGARAGAITVGGHTFAVTQLGAGGALEDDDGLPSAWEQSFGLDAASALGGDGPAGDADGDGLSNLEELRQGRHPRGFFHRYFAEGATSAFFDTTFAVVNSADVPARLLYRFMRGDATVVTQAVTVPPQSRSTLSAKSVSGLSNAEFATEIESDIDVTADRTMTWDASRYGSHAETSLAGPALQWYLAEGATHSGFQLFYLLQNPGDATAHITIQYLLPSPAAPVTKSYEVGANSRFNVWVNTLPELAATDVSAVITSDTPIIVERAMYLNGAGAPTFTAGHESAGLTAPATEWFLAEGATGPFFDLFVLIANPNDQTASVTADFLLPSGATVQRVYNVGAKSRFNIWVDTEGAMLADTAVSTIIRSDRPVLVERSMWWPGPTAATWAEAHNSPGITTAGVKWALGDGEQDGAFSSETYILIANTSPWDGLAVVTLYFEDGTTAQKEVPLLANSRTNVPVGAPEANGGFGAAVKGRRFGATVESVFSELGLGNLPAQIVVERAMYSSVGTAFWAAGTNAVATRVP